MLSKNDVLLPAYLFACVTLPHVLSANVPPLYVDPACIHIWNVKLAALSSSKAPVVSAGKVSSTLAQSVVTLNACVIFLVLSWSYSSATYVALALPFT